MAHLKAAKAQWVGKFGYLLLVIGQGFFGCCPPLTAIGLLVIAPPLKANLVGVLIHAVEPSLIKKNLSIAVARTLTPGYGC
ncbi:hypothetical protein, partial [Planktothricoides raciborskii]|uniref:hypothetical protein n=1 Tax=Planktothricoides raciborskii TaxID=132608 RepID=UPI001A7E6387